MNRVRQKKVSRSVQGTIDDCWNRIGVRGDGSCPELEQHTHCRNCPVLSGAAGQLFDGELSPERIAEWTQVYAQPKHAEETGTHSIFIFRIGSEWLALPTSVLEEVASVRPVHSLPHRRNRTVRGVVSVRGTLLVCVSLAEMLGIEKVDTGGREGAGKARGRLLVAWRDANRLAFPVDEVHGVHRYHPRMLESPPSTLARAAATFTRAMLPWNEHAVGCLDDNLLFQALNRSLA